MIAVLRALKLHVPGEARMACWLFTTAASPGTELQQVFLKGLCSHARIQMALTQLQHHHLLAAQNSQVYSVLLPRLSSGQLMLRSLTAVMLDCRCALYIRLVPQTGTRIINFFEP